MRFSDLNLLDIGNEIQLAGAVYAGKGQILLCMFPEEHGHDFSVAEPLDMDIEDWKRFLFQADVCEVEVQAKQADGTYKKAILRKSQRQIEQAIFWKVFRRDGMRCRYCGNDSVPLTVDHLVCWEVGGPNTEENLVASCRKCNRTRGNMPYKEWIQSDFYGKVSKGLTAKTRVDNVNLIRDLDKIPLVDHVRSR